MIRFAWSSGAMSVSSRLKLRITAEVPRHLGYGPVPPEGFDPSPTARQAVMLPLTPRRVVPRPGVEPGVPKFVASDHNPYAGNLST